MIQGKKNAAPEKRKRYDHSRGRTRLFLLPVHALLLTLIVEILNRGSVPEMITYVGTHPFYFLYNVLLILTTLTFSELFKCRRSVLFTISCVWLGLAIGQFCVVRERIQPFTSMDLLMFGDAVTLTTLYYTWPEIILMCVGIFIAAFAVIWIIAKLPKRRKVNYTVSATVFIALVILSFCLCTLGVSFGAYPRYFENLVEAYDKYGFAACFTFTFGDMGVNKPSKYSTETVTGIVEELEEPEGSPKPTSTPGPHVFGEEDNLAQPNIIFVQLESLIDANTVIGSSYSKDPTPNFNRLSREFPSGELYVSAIGGGTANVEFEMLTGFNLDFFGAGEYPYTTVLQQNTCESIAYTLLEQGYETSAMHNHTGTFYDRNEVYSRLGFKHYISLEYMPYATYSGIGWAEDTILDDEIMKALNASDSRDFVMAITVESHGKYEDEYTYTEGDPEILQLPDQINRARFANYLHLIHETDEFIGELIGKLEVYDEPVICVFYGDHLPALDFTPDVLTTNNLYASRYIIWNNYGAEFEAPNLQAYRVSANLLKQLGMTGGVISKYHQSAELHPEAESEYFTKLEMLEYDLLYGDQSVYENGENPYKPVDLMMGTLPIEITSVSNAYGRLLVTGKNFTEYSTIFIDGTAYPTAFVSSSQIVAVVPRTTPVSSIYVAQLATDGSELGRTEDYKVE